MILEAYATCKIYLACAKAWMRSDINHEWVILPAQGAAHRDVTAWSSCHSPFRSSKKLKSIDNGFLRTRRFQRGKQAGFVDHRVRKVLIAEGHPFYVTLPNPSRLRSPRWLLTPSLSEQHTSNFKTSRLKPPTRVPSVSVSFLSF